MHMAVDRSGSPSPDPPHEMTTYNKLCIIAKSNHYLGCIEEASGDPKALNRVLKSILRRDEVTKLPLYSSQDTLANQFADFFEDKVQKNRDGPCCLLATLQL